MSSRIALPLRLVQCNWSTAGATTTATCTPVLTPYKPSGLPCYASSQASAVSSSAESRGSDEGRLFAIHTRHASARASSSSSSLSGVSYEAAAQPRPEDPSDSLLTRVVDAALPGCRPYVALPVVSSLLRRSRGEQGGAAALLNQWTCRHKGLVLVTQTPSDALFQRNAAQLDLVQQTFRVACRLPADVAVAVRSYLRVRQSQVDGGAAPRGAAAPRWATVAAALNPYLRAHTERHRTAEEMADLTFGIPLAHPAGSSHLPPCVRSHPLVSGGFFDVARGLLRVQGTASCFLRPQTPLHPASAAKVEQQARLQRLFMAPAMSSIGVAKQDIHTQNHPWLKPGWRLGISLDAPHMQAAAASPTQTEEHQPQRSGSLPAPRGKRLSFNFRLLSLSTQAGCDVALYEVHTLGDVTADEVAAVFHAEGLSVLNDYVQDTSLAALVEEVAQRMRAAPPAVLSALPMAVQHHLRTASAEELVALPLMLMPLEDADRICISQLCAAATGSSAAMQDAFKAEGVQLAEDAGRLQAFAHSLSGAAAARHPVHRLLWHALSSLRLANDEERQAYEGVLSLTLGSGVECVGLAFPDPSAPATVHAMQQIWLSYEQQRQRQASAAEAARAARQHPLAAELRFLRRSSLDEPTGVTRVPLLEDLVTGDSRYGSRGECSFSQGVALTFPLTSSEGVSAAAAAAAAWEQTEVPPSYAGAFHRWSTALATSSSSSSLWPLPSQWKQRTESRAATGDGNDTMEDVSKAALTAPPSPPPVRTLLRVEEVAELLCAHCGATGHTWQHCAARISDAMTMLDVKKGSSAAHLTASKGVSVTPQTPALPSPAAPRSVLEEEGLTGVDDVAAALHDQASALSEARGRRADELASDTDGGDRTHFPSSLVAVPNLAATQRFKAEYALRNEARKPAVHRRATRCVYCGGHHHVTVCPKLQAQNGEADDMPSSTQSMASAQLPPFCIKCGATGHLYRDCPRIPSELHPATHCPICRQRHTSHSHDPLHCPNRVPVPEGYALSGVPHAAAESPSPRRSSTSAGQNDARVSGGVSNGGGRGRGFAQRGRRRGSVLIADSFVDARARSS